MEVGKLDNEWERFFGRNVKVFVKDEFDVKKKFGLLIGVSDTHLFLDLKNGTRVDIILLSKIIRVEVSNDGR